MTCRRQDNIPAPGISMADDQWPRCLWRFSCIVVAVGQERSYLLPSWPNDLAEPLQIGGILRGNSLDRCQVSEQTRVEGSKEELGAILFLVAKVARMLHIDAEEALREANRKFKRRFQQMEAMIREEQRAFASYNLEE